MFNTLSPMIPGEVIRLTILIYLVEPFCDLEVVSTQRHIFRSLGLFLGATVT